MKKGVQIDHLCPWCMKEEETITHALIACKVQYIWFATNVGACPSPDITNFGPWISEVIVQIMPNFTTRVFALVWALWRREGTNGLSQNQMSACAS